MGALAAEGAGSLRKGRGAVESRVRWLQWTLSFPVGLLLPVGSGSQWLLVTVLRHSGDSRH